MKREEKHAHSSTIKHSEKSANTVEPELFHMTN